MGFTSTKMSTFINLIVVLVDTIKIFFLKKVDISFKILKKVDANF